MKEKTMNATIIAAIAGICEKRCKDAETCTESCPEEQHLIEMIFKYPIMELELGE